MRSGVLLSLLALAVAGCVDVPAGESAEETPSAGARSSVDVSFSHDFAPGETQTHTFHVQQGTMPLRIEAHIANCTQLNDMRIVVRDPSGSAAVEVSRTSGNVAIGVAGTCASDSREGVPAVPGEWKVQFSGQGVGTGAVEVVG